MRIYLEDYLPNIPNTYRHYQLMFHPYENILRVPMIIQKNIGGTFQRWYLGYKIIDTKHHSNTIREKGTT